jgi:hypothetical protein
MRCRRGGRAMSIRLTPLVGSSGGDPRLLLKYAPPVQFNPTIVNVPTGGHDYSGTPYGATEDVIFVLPLAPITGTLRWKGGRHVRMIGGTFVPTSAIGNYVIVGQQVSGSFFAEGIEFPDQSLGQPDVFSVCGDWSGSTQGFAPAVCLQNIRCMAIRASNATNHADFYQPQGVIGTFRADKITVESNYDVYTFATDSCNGVPPQAIFFDRHNTWWGAANATDPFTSPYWLNSTHGDGTANGDTMPSPTVFGEGMYCDTVRGVGRDFAGKIENAIYPHGTGSSGLAGGGTLRSPPSSGNSPFAANEVIGAADAADHSYCTVPNPKMLVRGRLWRGSPPLDRPDVTADLDGLGSFVAPNIGTGYRPPGYLLTPGVDFAL